MSDTITLNRKDVAKFMALCGQTIICAITKKNLTKGDLKEAYEAHMQPELIEFVIKGSAEDFDQYQQSNQEATALDLENFINEELQQEEDDE